MDVSFLLSSAMVLGPVVGYVDQYAIIRKTQSSAGFNSATCAILLFANILRIFFWVGKRFDTTLLVQSIVMILAQLILLQVVVEYQHSSPSTLYGDVRSSFSSSSLLDEDLQAEAEGYESRRPWYRLRFWHWDHYLDYVNCLLAFTTIIALLYFFLRSYPAFIEVLGALSLGIESTLPMPQCISSFRRKSTSGFSKLVLASWFLGDGFKLFYFIYTNSPLQFIICGAIQLSIDTMIVVEFVIFSSRVKKWMGTSTSWLRVGDENGMSHF
ncbi:hypothetical protein J3Q64DRAFT_1725665 [Phycomyces blakesleeanus]|uniref:PQ-loop repeat-containing protein 1 n=1 Tax=Phycomyces blakesleeanus TaxID=4837 RepID=A0ABR3B788_PHYBL